jgi:recombination protein RecT
MSNSIAKKPSFSVAINTTQFKSAINNALQDPDRARRFTSSIVSAVSTNPALQECDAGTIVTAALLGESLNLSPSPQLGQYYLVPFNDSKRGGKVAQFQLGYKGYMQLAMRSGEIKKLVAIEVKEGELVKYNPFDGEFEANYIEDEDIREQTPTVGYYAMFELTNGFRQILYWTKAKMERHALQFSNGYKAKKGYTFWEKDFDSMARKTMLRQIISKGGCPMSIEMQKAYEADMGVVNEDNTITYIDSPEADDTIPAETVPTEAPKEVSLDEL